MLSIHINPEAVFYIGRIPVTNTLLMSWIVVVVLIVIAQIVSHRISLVPKGFQNVVEYGFESLLETFEKVLGSRKAALTYFPFITTIFVLILISNWLGILPGIGSIGVYHSEEGHRVLVPVVRSLASDLNFTLAIAIISVIVTNLIGFIVHGRHYASKFLSFKNPISFFVGLLELLGEFVKVISFSFRLFGNIFAGEVLLTITGFLLPFLVPVPFLFLEIFVGFIQALVFATLTLVFISIAIADPH